MLRKERNAAGICWRGNRPRQVDKPATEAMFLGVEHIGTVICMGWRHSMVERANEVDRRGRRRAELLTFFILAFGIWPIVAVAVVGGYGFLVWMWQIVFGPPGPPAGGMH